MRAGGLVLVRIQLAVAIDGLWRNGGSCTTLPMLSEAGVIASIVEARNAIPGGVGRRVPLLMAREQVETNKLLVATRYIALEDLLGVIWTEEDVSSKESRRGSN